MITVVGEFIAGETVWRREYIYDVDGSLVDPTTIKITITDSDATAQVSAEDMTQSDTGIYDYYYNTSGSSATGQWHGYVEVVDGSGADAKTCLDYFSFKVR